jgi:hypothetical protein
MWLRLFQSPALRTLTWLRDRALPKATNSATCCEIVHLGKHDGGRGGYRCRSRDAEVRRLHRDNNAKSDEDNGYADEDGFKHWISSLVFLCVLREAGLSRIGFSWLVP